MATQTIYCCLFEGPTIYTLQILLYFLSLYRKTSYIANCRWCYGDNYNIKSLETAQLLVLMATGLGSFVETI